MVLPRKNAVQSGTVPFGRKKGDSDVAGRGEGRSSFHSLGEGEKHKAEKQGRKRTRLSLVRSGGEEKRRKSRYWKPGGGGKKGEGKTLSKEKTSSSGENKEKKAPLLSQYFLQSGKRGKRKSNTGRKKGEGGVRHLSLFSLCTRRKKD